ncbi:putative phage integrase [Candidatus Jettenia caeni]|uniref:Putative phage integrase n=1 Tax=Candidatus Jettenia caeni TaxID=247490 RepID=I3ILZ2_9BACT|nr:site-specific integrase [Candidatus Jettenia sp. AMX1]NUN23661.1 site-specific integrase [Candidatus Jettenia caeni]GAB62737.1 putative phage integrase [Candidatus Jettenia caeni]GIL19438.1 MAG: integrase [Candidatus Jettenia caeni]GJQ46380.1 MAG: integrase [Candidatus Jettenia caeni]
MGLYKRGLVWWMRFTYKGQQVRKSTETTDKKLAERIYHKVKTQITEGKWFDVDEGNQRTFEELAEKYETQVFRELKGWRSSISYLNQLKDFFGKYRLAEITPARIDDFRQMRKNKGVKPATINRQFKILRRMFNLAKKRWQWIKETPIIEMEPNADVKRVRHLSFDEFNKLLNCCEGKLRDIVIVAAWTGLRQSNILNLKWNQVDLLARVIVLSSEETKNNESLRIPIANPAYHVLEVTMKKNNSKSPYVFYSDDGMPFKAGRIQINFKKALRRAEIEDFRFHDLRHCFASWNRQSGVDLDTLAELMGHKDTRMTRRYAHITPVHLKKAVELLEKSYSEYSTKLAQSNIDVVKQTA